MGTGGTITGGGNCAAAPVTDNVKAAIIKQQTWIRRLCHMHRRHSRLDARLQSFARGALAGQVCSRT
jgi:hypothetical protein